VAKTAENIRLLEPFSRERIQVAVVENQRKLRESWCRQINYFPDFACNCACATGEEALKTISLDQPDVVLIDIVLPQMSGIECTYRLKGQFPDLPVVVFTALEDSRSVFRSLEAGADGYLLKRTIPSDLRNALLEVLGGGAPMSAPIARRVVEYFRSNSGNRRKLFRLTPKEEMVIELLSLGLTNKGIAHKLEMSLNTVMCHLKHVFRKLQVGSRMEAVICYMSAKVLPRKAKRRQGVGQVVLPGCERGLVEVGKSGIAQSRCCLE